MTSKLSHLRAWLTNLSNTLQIGTRSLTCMASQVAIYALLKMAIEVEVLLSHERHNNPSPVKEV